MQVALRSPWAPPHTRSRCVHVAAAAGGGPQQRPAKPTGRRRGKALLQDVALKPGEQGDELLEQITRDLKNGIEVGGAGRVAVAAARGGRAGTHNLT